MMVKPIEDLPLIPKRAPDSHKGTFGTVLVLGGSTSMAGAPALTGMAALKCGAGLCQVGVPATIQPIVAAHFPCYTTVGLAADSRGILVPAAFWQLQPYLQRSTVLAVGPGMGQSMGAQQLLVHLLQLPIAIVVDADALNNLAALSVSILKPRKPSTILTPHPGEFARLLDCTTSEIAANRETLAVQFAQQNHCILVLKGHETLVTDGEHLYRNGTGNPGMATGGSGDVLTGMIAALVAQGLEPFLSAQLAVYLHGRAGDIAATRLSTNGLTAQDILQMIPLACLEHDQAPFSSA